jgi:metal-responsive CopG/Arc/MetJ family transcriptional regulator
LEVNLVVKINVSISKEVLEQVDRAARESKTSRSSFLTLAVMHFLEERREAKQRDRGRKAADKIVQIADKIGPWNAAEELLSWRSRH